ncbi:MAG: DUF1549 domain-containing protein [Verrucomicrobiota bacterium]
MKTQSIRSLRFLSTLVLLPLLVIALTLVIFSGLDRDPVAPIAGEALPNQAAERIASVDAAFERAWRAGGVSPTEEADELTLVRRLSLALTGAAPSLEEIRRLDTLPENADPVQSWLTHLFEDPRYHHYFAERLTRAFVGVEPGPFLVYRRRRLVNWIADQLAANRPYDSMVRHLVASEGVWTTHPEANFITAAVIEDGDKRGPDEIKLAARTSRAFLGISLDCMQCHDDKFGDYWTQEHFHELAAFYGQSEMSLTGVREDPSEEYEIAFLGEKKPRAVDAEVPFQSELLPASGNRRARLAHWITHEENRAFARAAVNRVWALVFGRPLHDPVDEIPLDGPFPPGMEEITDFFIQENHDYQALLRLIAASAPFRRESRSADPSAPVTQKQERAWAAFPVTPLRPEQVAGSIIQAASLQALDGEVHILTKLRRFGETNNFVERYGDQGENEFTEEAGTIPQRLLLMNGDLVAERTSPNLVANSVGRLAAYAPSESSALEAAFLATLTRLPSHEEKQYFLPRLEDRSKEEKEEKEDALEDIFWALINATEFSWNR